MLKILFIGMLEVSTSFYGDSIGLAPISLSANDLDLLQSRDDEGEATIKD